MIGIMSDSHDDLDAIHKAVDFFNSRSVSLVIHAGDIISPFTNGVFKELSCPMRGVFGNNDGEREQLNAVFSRMGVKFNDFITFEAEGLNFAVYHGVYDKITRSLASSGDFDVVVCGHSHKPLVEHFGKTVLVNPGETCGYVYGKRTVAILDPSEMQVGIHNI